MDIFDNLLAQARTGNVAQVKSVLNHHHFSQYDWPTLLATSVSHETAFHTLLAACPQNLLGVALPAIALTENTHAFDALAQRCIEHDDDADGHIGNAGWECAHGNKAGMLKHILQCYPNYIDPPLDYMCAAVYGNALNALDFLIDHGMSDFVLHRGLKRAVEEGRTECAERLVALVDVAYDNHSLITTVVVTKNPVFVQMIAQRCEPVVLNQLLEHVCAWGNSTVVRHLLSLGADPTHDRSRPLRMACSHNHKEIVEILLPLCTCVEHNSLALMDAALKNNENIVDLLLPHSDVPLVIEQIEQYSLEAAELIHTADAKRVRAALNAALDEKGVGSPRRLKI